MTELWKAADSSTCICCKRSKTGGAFFELSNPALYDPYKKWEAHIDVFRKASDQGCQRCAVALEMVEAWKRGNPEYDWRYITVESKSSELLVADLILRFSESKHGKSIRLELLSANHRYPGGMVDNFAQWNIITMPLSYEDPTSDDALQHTIESLWHCLSHHKHCSNSLSKLPKRYLDLNPTTMTLRDSASNLQTERYACLSYCWGSKRPSLQLTSKTESHLRQGVELDLLPRTFLEAAKVCLKLDIQYLWVDALCIIQGDEADWTEAAATMADIYENAFVTIAATCAADSDDGLRPGRDDFRPLRLGTSSFFVRKYMHDESDYFKTGGYTSPWPLLSRAWVFQECQLSPRILRFGHCQVIWDCKTTRVQNQEERLGHRLESHAIKFLPFFSLQTMSAFDSKSAWHYAIEQYSGLSLTYQSDVLPAISALAQRMAKLRVNDTYLAGMWRKTLLSDLQWTAFSSYSRTKTSLPTWSWASCSSNAEYREDQRTLDNVKIIGLDYIPVGPAEIGHIEKAVLTMQGPTLPLHGPPGGEFYPNFKLLHPHTFLKKQKMKCIADNEDFKDPADVENQTFLGLLMWTGKVFALNGLILREVGDVYERVGSFHFFRSDFEDRGALAIEQVALLPVEVVCIV